MQQSNKNELGKQMFGELISSGADLRDYVKKQGIKLSKKYTLKFIDACNVRYPETITREVVGSRIGLAAQRQQQVREKFGQPEMPPTIEYLHYVHGWGRACLGYDRDDFDDPNVYQLAIDAMQYKERNAKVLLEAALDAFMLQNSGELAKSASGTVVVTMTNPTASYEFYEALPTELTSGLSYTGMQHCMMQHQKLAVSFE